jgi:hypothetical protein
VARVCLFCDHKANSREHIFPDWINKIFNPNAIGPVDAEVVQYGPDGTVVNTWPTKKVAGHRHRIVCECCNGSTQQGWMCDLEGEVSPILTPIIRGFPTDLSQIEQLLVARWAAKTAMVAETIMKFPATFTRPDAEIVRTQGRPPLRARVLIAAWEGEGVATRYLRSIGDVTSDGTPFMDLYVHTIQVGCLVLQVRGTTTFPASENISLSQIARAQAFEISVFPPVEICRWPPAVRLKEQSLGKYSAAGKDPPVPPAGTYSAKKSP